MKLIHDLTYCSGTNCPIRSLCSRYNKESFHAQLFGTAPILWISPQIDTRNHCPMFLSK